MKRRCVRSDAVREHLHGDGLIPDDIRDPEARRRVQRLGTEEPSEHIKELKPDGHGVGRL